MDITEVEKTILLEIFHLCHEQKKWVNAERFMVDHEDHVEIIKGLVKRDLIRKVSHCMEYRVVFGVFVLIEDSVMDEMLDYMQAVFDAIKAHYKKELQEPYYLKNMASDVSIDQAYIVECILYMRELISVYGTTDLSQDDAYIAASSSMLDFKSFDDVIDRQYYYWRLNAPKKVEPKKLRPQQIDRLSCQCVAKTLWDIYPDMNIRQMCEHPSILNHAGGKNYVYKTLRGWLSKIDPRDEDKKRGRPKKK